MMSKRDPKDEEGKNLPQDDLPGYPYYPDDEDIYNKDKREMNIDPDDNSTITVTKEKRGKWNEKGFEDDVTGGDLDIPGAELDDENEMIGNEDEENDYYSLGGDDHNDLEESRD